jgi:hypothetical protein
MNVTSPIGQEACKMYNDVSKQAKNKLKKATFIINGGD